MGIVKPVELNQNPHNPPVGTGFFTGRENATLTRTRDTRTRAGHGFSNPWYSLAESHAVWETHVMILMASHISSDEQGYLQGTAGHTLTLTLSYPLLKPLGFSL